MLLNRVLTINNIKRQLVDERVKLDLYSTGRALFTVVSDDKPLAVNQLVTFDLGYSTQDNLQRWFIGFTEKVVPMGDRRVKVFCRELSAALANPLPLNLRHVSLREVVAEIHKITGLNFATPDADYSTRKVANFFNVGSGYQAMAAIGSVFNIADYLWQQQSGVIYVGSWADSRWSTINNMQLPANLFDGQSAQNSAKVAAIPQLRPGLRINGQRLTSVEFEKNHMVIAWI